VPLLFSYGTLQQPEVQLATFGRLLEGRSDALPGFEASQVAITDPQLLHRGKTHHANVVFNGRGDTRAGGTVYVVTEAELAAAGELEKPFAYARTAVTLASAKEAWVYLYAPARVA
jgi:gamma-glutamylcyclotransferase (GGCT)/AIG2-like uncharacterized protein YtfP